MNSSRPYLRMNARNGPHSESSMTASMADSRSVWLCCTQMVRNESAILRRISTSGSVGAAVLPVPLRGRRRGACRPPSAGRCGTGGRTRTPAGRTRGRSSPSTWRAGPGGTSPGSARAAGAVREGIPAGPGVDLAPQDRPRPAALGQRDEQQRLAGQGPDEAAAARRGRRPTPPAATARSTRPAAGLPRGARPPAPRFDPPATAARARIARPTSTHVSSAVSVRWSLVIRRRSYSITSSTPADRVGDLDLVERLDELLEVAGATGGRSPATRPASRRRAPCPAGRPRAWTGRAAVRHSSATADRKASRCSRSRAASSRAKSPRGAGPPPASAPSCPSSAESLNVIPS